MTEDDHHSPALAPRLIGRYYFLATALVALFSAVVLTALFWQSGLTMHLRIVVSLVGFAAVCCGVGLACRRPGFPVVASLCVGALISIAFTGWLSWVFQDGLHNPALGFGALIVCIISAITNWRCGVLVLAGALLQLAGLAYAESSGWLLMAWSTAPGLQELWFQVAVLVCSWVGGSVISWMLNHYLQAAFMREKRFRGLLKLAADRYWEHDQNYRFTYVSDTRDNESGAEGRQRAVKEGWDLSDMGLSEERLDAHRTELDARRPFTELLVRRRDAKGRTRIHSLSGEPKFDEQGVFCGYWGVTRDVTDELRRRRSFKATENRYRELFTRSPSPFFLHRNGVIFDANVAAARLFGFESAAAMAGIEVMSLIPAKEARQRVAERMAQLEGLSAGASLPVMDLQARSVDGRALSLQATGVRVDSDGGRATLSIFFDITARHAAEAALVRSEAMLSHLFATSPDCIMLIDVGSGRFAMVNSAFTQLTGYSADEVQGLTPAALGLWGEPGDPEQLAARVVREGTVSDAPALMRAKSGAQVSMLLSAACFVMDQRAYLVVNARDVTETERTRLEHSAILEQASIGIAFTRDNCFVQTNPYFERMFGWQLNGLRGAPLAAVWPTQADYLEMGHLSSPLLSAGQPFEVERMMLRQDGSNFWCRLLAQAVDRSDPSRGGTIWIAEDITERRRLDKALAAARDAAEAASHAKSAFLANTSHEIRTPLNGLLGLARLAMQEELPAQRRRQYLSQIFESAQGLSGIISDILDVSKIEAGKMALEDVPFGLHETLHDVHHAYQSLADVKGLSLTLVIEPGVPQTVRGDPVRVRQILSNLVTNALKFTESGQVRIEATSSTEGRVRLAVTDTGPGVETATQALLFTPFSQGDTSTTRRFGGTGLGLSICRELARLMGGEVGLASELGQGSTFWAELPLPPAQPAEVEASTEARDMAQLRGASILMVEDNPVNMMIAVAMLEQWGMHVAQAHDGRMAVNAVHKAASQGQPFDAVLMDIQMPTMSGHEATRELRRHFAAHQLPIVALTAAALVSERDDALRAGMNDFLTKPIDAPKLRQTLAHFVKLRLHASSQTDTIP
jgi:PAS domain S-box-containing protein